jgi:hypothetical protein
MVNLRALRLLERIGDGFAILHDSNEYLLGFILFRNPNFEGYLLSKFRSAIADIQFTAIMMRKAHR